MKNLVQLTFLFVFFSTNLLWGQNSQIDSLKEELTPGISSEDEADRLIKIGTLYKRITLDSALLYFFKAQEVCVILNNKNKEGKVKNNIALVYYLLGEFEKALDFAHASQNIMQEISDPVNEAKAKNTIGITLTQQGQYDEAWQILSEVYDFFNSTNDTLLLSFALNNLAKVKFHSGDISGAIEYFYEALKLKEKLGDQYGLANAYNNIASLYGTNGDNEKAIDFFKMALKISRANQFKRAEASALANLGIIYHKQDKSSQALKVFTEGIEVNKTLGDQHGIAFCLVNLGKLHLEKSEISKGIDHLKEAEAICLLNKDRVLFSDIYNGLGLAFNKSSQTTKAIKYYEKSLAYAEQSEEKYSRYLTIQELADLHGKVGNFKRAYEFKKEAFRMRDSIFSLEKAEKTAELQTQYETEKKEAQLAKQQLTIAQQQNTQKNLVIGGAFGLLFLFGFFQYFRNRQKLKQQKAELSAEIERTKVTKLHELNEMKSNFFANISHEFRTPLTLILGPVRQMLEGSLKGDTNYWLRNMEQHGNRLLNLVNQLLDLSRLESGKMELKKQTIDINRLFKSMVYSFESLAESREMEYHSITEEGFFPAQLDQDKTEKILTNLLSNAFKFTEDGGKITAKLSREKEKSGWFQIEISDTGSGISENDMPHLFERFYQTENSNEYGVGSGIGLALTKELVELQGGNIHVMSHKNEGTTFIVNLPIGSPDLKGFSQYEEVDAELASSLVAKNPIPSKTLPLKSNNNDQLLLVEDNADLRYYIKEQLKTHYTILEANDGKDGLKMAIASTPDLIISDVMMPKMNGIELCEQLKTNEKTSHIPVILLTAKSEQSDKLEGLETGADAYLTKPFDPKELLLRVQKLIEQRQRLRDKFGADFNFKPTEIAVNSTDMAFLKNVKEVIENHLGDELFGVPELSLAIGFSRSQLHRKLNALTNKSPSQLIREMRLYRAKELLIKKAGNASEVAYRCGFSSPAQFSKSFKKFFNKSPSEC